MAVAPLQRQDEGGGRWFLSTIDGFDGGRRWGSGSGYGSCVEDGEEGRGGDGRAAVE